MLDIDMNEEKFDNVQRIDVPSRKNYLRMVSPDA